MNIDHDRVAARTGCPARNPDVWVRLARGRNTLLDPLTGTQHTLDDAALAIWDICDGRTFPDEMIAAISQLLEVDHELVAQQVLRTLDEFERLGLVEWRD